MLLQLKNKNLQALKKVIDDAVKIGGIPKQVVVTPVEAADLLREHVDLAQEDIKSNLKFEFVDEDASQCQFYLRGKEIPLNHIKEFVKKWFLHHIKVTFNSVPLIIQASKQDRKKAKKVTQSIAEKGKEWHH